MSFEISLGLSALRASQVGIDVVGQNIANANTPGYHRQVARFESRPPLTGDGYEKGTGVDVSQIQRVRSQVLELSRLQYSSDAASVETQLETARHVETLFASGAGSLSDGLNTFYQRMEELSARPHDETGRGEFVRAAGELAETLRRLTDDLERVKKSNVSAATSVVEQVNSISEKIGRLNREINVAESLGRIPNDLLDRKDALTNDLAQLLDVNVNPRNGSLIVGDGSILIGLRPTTTLELRESSDGVQLFREGDDRPIVITQGRLDGQLFDINSTVPELVDALNSLANGVMRSVDAIHVQGVGLDGPFERLTGQRPVVSADLPISSVVPSGWVNSGTLPVTVVDQDTGERTLHEIAIDPDTDSLADIAGKMSVPHLLASVDPATNNLVIQAESGFAFDFTGLGTDLDIAALKDESGLLAALGMNTLFTGSDAQSMAVNSELSQSTSRLATSLTGQPGDSRNLTAMIATRSAATSLLDGQTTERFLGNIVSQVGASVSSLDQLGESTEAILANLDSQIASVSGVNPDEEVLRLLQYQRSYEAAARFLSTVNETLDELLQII